MPSPIGHSLAGLCGFYLAYPQIPKTYRIPALAAAIFVSNSPDLDILAGLILHQDPSILHRQGSHSFLVAIVIGCLTVLLTRIIGLKEWNWLGIWLTGLYSSHIFLDMLVADGAIPYGLQAFWPLSSDYFMSPLAIFNGLDYNRPGLNMLQSMMTFNNLIAALKELAILAPSAWLTWGFGLKAYKQARLQSPQ